MRELNSTKYIAFGKKTQRQYGGATYIVETHAWRGPRGEAFNFYGQRRRTRLTGTGKALARIQWDLQRGHSLGKPGDSRKYSLKHARWSWKMSQRRARTALAA